MKDVGKKAIEAAAVVAAGANPTGAMVAEGYMLLTAYLTPRYSRHLWRAARTASRPRVKLASAELRLIAFG